MIAASSVWISRRANPLSVFWIGRGARALTPRLNLLVFNPATSEELVRVLDRVWEHPRDEGTIPNVAPARFPDGVEALPTPVKKRIFLRAIAPHVVTANVWIRYERDYLRDFLEKGIPLQALEPPEKACVLGVAQRYRVELPGPEERLPKELREELLKRVDTVPVGLALAQAAIESGWGSSRFTRQGNSLFGQWVFSADKGMAPRERPAGANYAVARFDDLNQSVGAYLFNLNTFWAYEDLRTIRQSLRRQRQRLDSMKLAGGLRMYSERRDAYVEEVRTVMRANRLEDLDGLVFPAISKDDWAKHLDEGGCEVQLRQARLIAPVSYPPFSQ